MALSGPPDLGPGKLYVPVASANRRRRAKKREETGEKRAQKVEITNSLQGERGSIPPAGPISGSFLVWIFAESGRDWRGFGTAEETRAIEDEMSLNERIYLQKHRTWAPFWGELTLLQGSS